MYNTAGFLYNFDKVKRLAMNWSYGYRAESGYTYGYYVETMPIRLRWAALLQGHVLPEKNFRYLDAGCGQGFNLILAAAAHPESEFVGIDFIPEHIAHAKDLAQRCGLDNVYFIEGDFVALSESTEALGSFDYIVCHGITTWISPLVKKALFKLVGQCLSPGGVFYNSYNTLPGWSGVTPFQHLVALHQQHCTSYKAIQAAYGDFERLQSFEGTLLQQFPSLQGRIDSFKGLDPSYLVQEYANQYWQPVFFSQMMNELLDVKLSYLGSATLTEAFDTSLDTALVSWLNSQPTLELKEQLRDYAVNQSFRRDLYVKGYKKAWPKEYASLLGQQRFRANLTSAIPDEGQAWIIKGGSLELRGSAEVYTRVMKLLVAAGNQGITLSEIMLAQPDKASCDSMLSVVSMLVHGGWAFVAKNDSFCQKNALETNSSIVEKVIAGAPYKYLSFPTVGAAYAPIEVDWLMIDLDIKGVDEQEWSTVIVDSMMNAGRYVTRNNKPVMDRLEAIKIFEATVNGFIKTRRDFFRSMGAY